MSTRERMLLLVLSLLFGAAAVSLGAIATAFLPLDQLWTSLQVVHANLFFVLLSGGLALIALLMLATALRRNCRVESLLHHGPLGEVRICFKAVENLVLKASRNVKGIRDLKTRIVHNQAGIVIFLRAVSLPDVNIPQATAELQATVKEYVEEATGGSVAEIKVLIENVAVDTVKTSH